MRKITELNKKRKLDMFHDHRGAVGKGIVFTMVGLIIAIVVITALAPEVFTNLALFNASASPNAPSWLFTVLPIVIGAGLLFLVIRASMR